MKIAISSENYEILNSVIRRAKETDDNVVIAKVEKSLFDHIDNEDVDAYIISSNRPYAKKAVDFIKKYHPYIPVIIIAHEGNYDVETSDSVIPFYRGNDTEIFAKTVMHNVKAYTKNFETLQRLTAKMGDLIVFGECTYDPPKRILLSKGSEIQKLSPKQGGIFELLAANFGTVVKKDIILEKEWRESNYFTSRSLDVFTTHLRKILKDNNIPMTITNVSNIGLMLDYLPSKI
jgi:DNA-binding winged helix-turn-helix (wHTH) protein